MSRRSARKMLGSKSMTRAVSFGSPEQSGNLLKQLTSLKSSDSNQLKQFATFSRMATKSGYQLEEIEEGKSLLLVKLLDELIDVNQVEKKDNQVSW